MPLACPACGESVPAEAVNIREDTALCAACGEVFRVSAALPPPPTAAPVNGPEPLPGVLYHETTPTGGFSVFIPKKGFHAKAGGMFFFAAFWNAIVLVVAGGFIAGMIQGQVPLPLLLFFVPFVMVGVLMPLWGCWLAWGTTAIRLDENGFLLVRQLFVIQREKQIPLAELRDFEHVVAYTENYQPVHACCLRADRKKLNFAHKLNDADQEWLIGRLNATLATLQPREETQ